MAIAALRFIHPDISSTLASSFASEALFGSNEILDCSSSSCHSKRTIRPIGFCDGSDGLVNMKKYYITHIIIILIFKLVYYSYYTLMHNIYVTYLSLIQDNWRSHGHVTRICRLRAWKRQVFKNSWHWS